MRSAAALLVLVIAASAGAIAVQLNPSETRGDSFLFGDEGFNVFVAASLSDGARLYTDTFTPYGPFAAWTYRVASAIGGNGSGTYQALNVALSAASVVLMQQALARYGSLAWSVAWTLLALLPTMLAPGSLMGGLTVSTYVGLERFVISALVWGWRPGAERTHLRSALLGAAAGGLLWVRFGTTVPVLGGLLAADLIARDRAWNRTAVMAGGAAAAVAAFVLWAFAAHPRPVALDLVWPAFLLESYSWVSADMRWPALSPGVIVAQWAAPIAGVLLLAAAVVARRRAYARGPALVLAGTFLAGSLLTFHHAHHYRQFAWLLAGAGGFAALLLGNVWRMVALAAVVPAFLVAGKSLVQSDVVYTEMRTPAAGTMFLSPPIAERARALAAYAADATARGERILVVPSAGGWHAAFDVPVAGRHAWFLDGYVRPWEQEDVIAGFERLSAVIVCPESSDAWQRVRLPGEAVDRLRPLFTAGGRVADCTLLVRR